MCVIWPPIPLVELSRYVVVLQHRFGTTASLCPVAYCYVPIGYTYNRPLPFSFYFPNLHYSSSLILIPVYVLHLNTVHVLSSSYICWYLFFPQLSGVWAHVPTLAALRRPWRGGPSSLYFVMPPARPP